MKDLVIHAFTTSTYSMTMVDYLVFVIICVPLLYFFIVFIPLLFDSIYNSFKKLRKKYREIKKNTEYKKFKNQQNL